MCCPPVSNTLFQLTDQLKAEAPKSWWSPETVEQICLKTQAVDSGYNSAGRWKACGLMAQILGGAGFLGVPCSRSNGPQLCILVSRRQRLRPRIQAAQQGGEGPRRLVDIIRRVPDITRNYFSSRPRRALFGGIALLGGFYVAQTISLSFGALGVNDVIAAVLCVLLTEYATKFYYTRPTLTFPIALLNNFKMGFTYGLFIDAFKLAS
ncbi:hypothetical protein V2J09_012458 [Rumex salicifolius]